MYWMPLLLRLLSFPAAQFFPCCGLFAVAFIKTGFVPSFIVVHSYRIVVLLYPFCSFGDLNAATVGSHQLS
jgi:hypothetical protein